MSALDPGPIRQLAVLRCQWKLWELKKDKKMSDRINTIMVVLEKETRDDDCEAVLNAIRMIKGVAGAIPNVVNSVERAAFERARSELRARLQQVFNTD